MSKLTKVIRENMARALVAHRYADEAKELVRLNRTLADRVYAHCYKPDTLKAMDVIEKAFPGGFGERDYLYVNAGGYKVNIGGHMSAKWVKIDQEKPVKRRLCTGSGYSLHDISGDPKLSEEVKDFATRWRGFDDVCQTAYYEALSVLNTITTGKKLAEAWPEAMPVIGHLIPEDQRTLPVVQVSAINAKFKLPPKVSAEGANTSPESQTSANA